ncbi:ABC transporter permease [Porphyromonas macacae]|uniref:ABC transporter permease n=1 Tax=Porphyromonas macacae TaxID=28115 RepID=UPI0024AD6EEE|nr:ABC transporter permease [Porphyromonas macacae]
MFDRDSIQEIASSLRTNKLRTILTGFAVGWGVLLLVILLGAGQGLNNGIHQNIENQGMNSSAINIWAGLTTMPYKGFGDKRWCKLKLSDCDLILENLSEVKEVSPLLGSWAINYEFKERLSSGSLKGVTGNYQKFFKQKFVTQNSRFINEADNFSFKKVIVLNDVVANNLFGSPERAMNQVILVSKSSEEGTSKAYFRFTVVGVVKGVNGNYSDNYIPISTMRNLKFNSYMKYDEIHEINLLCPDIKTDAQMEDLHIRIARLLAPIHQYDPKDTEAIGMSSVSSETRKIEKVFVAMDVLLWVIGLSTLAIGIVGVVNIMQVAVTERRREFGIRKALGAKPKDIIGMVVLESIFVTLISGLSGLIVGVWLMASVSNIMEKQGWGVISIGDNSAQLLQDPIITIGTAIGAVFVMVMSGIIAGYLPARKAVKIQAIEAMHG